MKRIINTLAAGLLFALLAAIHPARAQVPPELQSFQDAAGERSILFRGKQAPRYAFPYNGHPYWLSPAFERGDITFEGNDYHDILINIDAYAQLALVQLGDRPLAVSLTPGQTATITAGTHRYVGVGPGEALPEGFYEVFGQGPEQVYKHVYKQLESSVTNANGTIIGYYDLDYRPDVIRHFSYFKTYFFRDAQGNFSRIKGRNALISRFPDRKQEIRRAIRSAQLDQSDFDGFCVAVLNFTAR